MQIFLDSASVPEIEKWLSSNVIDGVTTNPSIMYRDGEFDLKAGAKKLAALIAPRPLSVEVVSNDPEEMYLQGKEFASWGDNIVIKIPQINTDGAPCYGVMHRLEAMGIKVNATVALSLSQVILSAKAGASYISLFAGRISDEGGDATTAIADAVDWLEHWQYKSRLIVGSIRSVGDVLQAVRAGAHIVTVPPPLIAKMADHQYARETVRQFLGDVQKTASALPKKH